MLLYTPVYTAITPGVVLGIILIFSACTKNKKSTVQNFTFSKDGLAYIQFRKGQYFIYKDSATLKTDSIVVTESLFDTVSGINPGNIGGPFHYTAQDYTLVLSKIESSTTSIWLTGKAESLYDYSGNIYLVSPSSSGGYFFRYPPCNCENERNITSIVVEGKTYTDVISSSEEYVSGGSSIKYSYYWAKGVGLIKRTEAYDSDIKTYTLVRNN